MTTWSYEQRSVAKGVVKHKGDQKTPKAMPARALKFISTGERNET